MDRFLDESASLMFEVVTIRLNIETKSSLGRYLSLQAQSHAW